MDERVAAKFKFQKQMDRDLTVGEIVSVMLQNTPRGQWSMGKITEVFPGRDGHVRVVNVKVGNTEFR